MWIRDLEGQLYDVPEDVLGGFKVEGEPPQQAEEGRKLFCDLEGSYYDVSTPDPLTSYQHEGTLPEDAQIQAHEVVPGHQAAWAAYGASGGYAQPWPGYGGAQQAGTGLPAGVQLCPACGTQLYDPSAYPWGDPWGYGMQGQGFQAYAQAYQAPAYGYGTPPAAYPYAAAWPAAGYGYGAGPAAAGEASEGQGTEEGKEPKGS